MGTNFYGQLTKALVICIGTLVIFPIIFGFIGFFLPSFGYFPILGKSEFNLNYFHISFNIAGISKSIILSLFTGLVSTLLALFFSQVILLYLFKTRAYNYIKIIISPLIALPHITMAIGLIFVFSPSGLFFRLISPWLTGFDRPPNIFIMPDEYGLFLILGLILKEIPFFILVSLSALQEFSAKKIFDLGKSLQNSNFSSWCILIFPLIYKKIRFVIFIVIAFTASVVDMSLILAPSTPSTLAIRILQTYQSSDTDSLFIASNLALIQLFIIIILLLFWMVLEKIVSYKLSFIFFMKILSFKTFFIKKIVIFTSVILLFLSILGIISSLIWGLSANWYFPNFFPKSLTLDVFTNFYNENKSIIFISIFISFIVSLISSLLTIIWVELTEILKIKKIYLEWIIFIPLFIPQISFLIGLQSFIIIFDFDSYLLPLIIIQLFYVIPYSFIILAPSLREINKEIIIVATSLGKNRLQRLLSIKIPIVLSSLLTSFAIGMLVSFSLYTPVYFFGGGRITTLTVEALNLALSGSRQDLGVATFFQIIIPILILITVAYLSKKICKWRF
ncbi:ABC transporter permease subunit [Alphaproteobacteria bacterium]|nr:ABC transporter permease subunit [Alphaproteobacteria bacterium]